MSARVLVVDDEPAIRDAVVYALEREGYDVGVEGDGKAALERARAEPFDVLVVDLMLPGLPGTEVCRAIRAESGVPILMLTARSGEVDRVVGLELGADDYVTKPFSMAELVARIRALLRRRELDRREPGAAVRRIGELELDRVGHEVRLAGRPVHLTPSEFRLLELLSSEPGRAFGRAELVRQLWGSDFVADERACDTHVVALRRKLGRERIATVRGVGYKLVAV